MFGFAVTVYAAAILNFLIGGLAWLASSRLSSSPPTAGGRLEPATASDTHDRLLQWCGMVFVSGFLIISLEIVWFRVHHDRATDR